MSLFISGRKLFPRRPQQTSSGPIGQNQITCSPLNQSPIGLCAGALLPRVYCWSIPGKKKTKTKQQPGLQEQGRSGKWLMGRQSTMCHSLSLGLSRWHTQGKGSVAGGAVRPGSRSVGLKEREQSVVVCSQAGRPLRSSCRAFNHSKVLCVFFSFLSFS